MDKVPSSWKGLYNTPQTSKQLQYSCFHEKEGVGVRGARIVLSDHDCHRFVCTSFVQCTIKQHVGGHQNALLSSHYHVVSSINYNLVHHQSIKKSRRPRVGSTCNQATQKLWHGCSPSTTTTTTTHAHNGTLRTGKHVDRRLTRCRLWQATRTAPGGCVCGRWIPWWIQWPW